MPTFDTGSNNTSVVYTDPTAVCGSPLSTDPKLISLYNQAAFKLPAASSCAQYISLVWVANISKQIAWVIDAGGGVVNAAGQCLPGDTFLTAIKAIITGKMATLQGAFKDCTGAVVPTGTNMASCLDLATAVAKIQAQIDAFKIVGLAAGITIFASSTNSGTVSETLLNGTWVLTSSNWAFVFATPQIQTNTGYTVVMPSVGTTTGTTTYTYYTLGQDQSSGFTGVGTPVLVTGTRPWSETLTYTKSTTGVIITKTHTENGSTVTTYPKADFTAAR